MYAAMITGALLGERGRFKDCTDILNSCQESSPNNPRILFNLALVEYFKNNYDKSLTILVSYHQKHNDLFNESVEILFGITNFLLKNFQDSYKTFQKMVLLYPNKHSYVYNFSTYLHEYVKTIFKKTKRESNEIELSTKYLIASERIFKSLESKIGEKTNINSYPETWSGPKKKRIQAYYMNLKSGVANNLFYIELNKNEYNNSVKKDISRIEIENISKEERKRITDEHEYHKIRQQQEIALKKKREDEEMEKRAQIELQIANELTESVKLSKVHNDIKKKKKKPNKSQMIEDEEGNMPLLNFTNEEDDQEKKFQNISVHRPNIVTPAPRKREKGVNGEKRRLKKQKASQGIGRRDSDEMLDIEEFEEEKAPKRKMKYDMVGTDNDDEDSDIGEKMKEMDMDEEQIPHVNFGNDRDEDKDNENTF